MSAEPARPGPDPAGPATVIMFRGKTTPRRPDSERDDTGAHQRLADRIEELFLKHNRRTLTDPETQQVFLVTLGLVTDLLEGARVTGVLNNEQHHELHAMIEGMKAAPSLLK